MDLKYVVSQLLGLQDIIVEDIKIVKKELKLVIKVRQNKKKSFYKACGLQLHGVHEWLVKDLRGPRWVFTPMFILSFIISELIVKTAKK